MTMSLVEQIEINLELTEFIKQHALVMDMQANPIALLDKSSTILYANAALHHLLNTTESLATLEQFNTFFRGSKQSVISCIKENTSRVLEKAVKSVS